MALTIFASASVGISAYLLSQKTLRENLRERLKSISETAGAVLDIEALEKIRGPEDEESEAYKKNKLVLQKIRNANPDVRFVYTMRKVAESLVQGGW